jgi:hypothetical protein
MVTWCIVDDDVDCLHVGRNPTMACNGPHLYKFYRLPLSMPSPNSLLELSCCVSVNGWSAGGCCTVCCATMLNLANWQHTSFSSRF